MDEPTTISDGGIASLAADGLPWEPLGGLADFKLLRTDGRGGWVSLVRVRPGGVVPLHRHEGLAQGYVLAGEGTYAGTRHALRAGSYVVEAAGTVDELRNTGAGDLVVLFVVEGPVRFRPHEGEGVLSTAQQKVAQWPHAYIDVTQPQLGGRDGLGG